MQKVDMNMLEGNDDLQAALGDLDAQLADTTKQLNLRNYVRYGKIDLPNDFFHNIDFRLFRDIDGKIKHTFNPAAITSGYSVFYVSETGTNSNDGLTEGTAWKSLNYAIDTIEANGAVTHAKIIITSSYLSRNNAQINSKTLTKDYCIEAKTGSVILATSEATLSWTADGASFRATRSSVTGVFDKKYLVEYGVPTRYEKKATKAECNATRGSWYTDGTSVWVNTTDGRTPDANIFTCLNVTLWSAVMGADKKIIARNIIGLNGSEGQALNIYSTGNIGHIILENVEILNGQAATANSIQLTGIKYAWLFNVISAYGGRDGINYHTSIVDAGIETFVLEYDCLSFENGLNDAVNSNNNCSTAHDGIRILRIGTIAYRSKGPVIADVNGCYSILVDCVSHDSSINTGRSTKVAYYFDDAISTLATSPNGKAILINCQGGGDVTWSISGDASFKNGKIQVLNFVGQNFPTDLNLATLNEVTQ